MDISVRDATMTAMWRFHDAALERAALIYTFARSTIEDTPEGYAIYSRQLPMLIDTVHEFCFNARRAIERAEKCRPGIIANLQALKVHSGRGELSLSELDHPKSITLTQESFWWVLGRIIHSKETQVIYRTVNVVITNESTGRHHSVSQPVAFGFSSNRDSDRINHFIELESFVTPYAGGISYQIEQAIQIRNNVPSSGSAS
ncbi:hypothetical protein F6X40_32655 [Paraburkholderia sp. UCT31]|uniref:hypothetical protein n=1 Tax=Paraburkholderia sp. UCT31 TaxID=2615209 RepID=UPI0016555A5C|nr:hypothetical protein [Paraburkholderia sp. UCT31]MBC8741336.1 hypothetical protein [Paraburkholderia sp. UCT31]